MPTPKEIQARIQEIGADTSALRAYLQSLSQADYNRWASSPERTSSVGAGAAETIGLPAAAVAAPFLGALTMLATGAPITVGATGPVGAGVLGGFGAAAGAGGSLAAPSSGSKPKSRSQIVSQVEDVFQMSLSPEIRAQIDAAAEYGASPAEIVAAVERRLGITAPDPVSTLAGVTATTAPDSGAETLVELLNASGYRPLPDNPNVYFNPITGDSIDISTGRSPSASGSVATPPTERFGFQQVGNQIFRAGDISGDFTPTGITVPGFSQTFTDRNGNLVGLDLSGQYQVIQPGFGFAEIDPERTFAENVRQFDVSEQGTADRAALNAQVQGFQSINALAPQLGRLALDNAQFTKDTLSKGGDYLARAFFQRGSTSPLPTVSQADIINQLRENIAGFQGALSGFGGVQQRPLRPETKITSDPAKPVEPEQQRAPQSASKAPAGALSALSADQRAQVPEFVKRQIPGFAMGGHTTEPMMRVGEKGDEIIVNPTNAPLAIIPHDDVSERMRKKAPGFQDGTGLYDFSRFTAPTLPTPAPANQNDLVSLAKSTAPPAVTAAATGGSLAPMRFGFALPTPETMGGLTGFERDALGTYLNVVEQTSLEDVEKQVQRQFSPSRTRGMGFRTDVR